MSRSRYTIVRKLATGGMAEIFLATQHGAEGFQRPVVLKRILADLSADPQFRNALIDEAHVAMGLTHSNIAQVLDLGTNRGRYFLAMELVDGWDLNRLLRRGMAADLELPPPLALFAVTEVCRALAFAHAKAVRGEPLGIVHRDISPHNILVSEQGEVKLTDFGIAKALIKRDKTATGVVKGKISYMAPEQTFGAPLDARADLFSLGVTLYVATTGIRPFDGDSEIETLLRVRDCRYVPPAKARPGLLPPALCKLIERAMQKEPKDRFQTAEEMLVEAERVLRTLPPAGPTELKRWLAALGAKDGKLAPSRLSAPPPEVSAGPALEEADGATVELDDASASAALPQGPEPTPAPGVSKSLSLAIDVVDEPGPAPRRSGRRAWLLFVLALAAGGYYVSTDAALRERLFALAGRPAPAPAPVAAGTGSRDAGAAVDAAVPVAPSVEPAGLDASTEPDGSSEWDAAEPASDASEPADASEPESGDAGTPEPDGGEPEVEIEPDAGPAATAPRPGPARPAAAAKPAKDMVSIRVLSAPPGASVRVEKTTFGVTPMRLRFRPGITYEIHFAKAGYLPASRLYTVTRRADQAVSATLAKEPAPRRTPKR